MTNYAEAIVKLRNTQPKKLKFYSKKIRLEQQG